MKEAQMAVSIQLGWRGTSLASVSCLPCGEQWARLLPAQEVLGTGAS